MVGFMKMIITKIVDAIVAIVIHDEDWIINPRCCQQLWDLGFDDADSCREHYDEISYVDGYRDTWRLRIWEWAIGTLVIGGIILILTLCCCWRRGKVTNL